MPAPSPPEAFGTRMPSRRCALIASKASAGNLDSKSTALAYLAATAATACARTFKLAGATSTVTRSLLPWADGVSIFLLTVRPINVLRHGQRYPRGGLPARGVPTACLISNEVLFDAPGRRVLL